MQRFRVLLASVLMLAAAHAADPAFEDGLWQGSGRLQMANGHPFAALFLDAPLLEARIPRRPRLAVRLTQSSTMALSPNVLDTAAGGALHANQQAHRPQSLLDHHSLAATARTHPAETYLFAGTETSRLTFDYTLPLTRRCAVAVELPFVAHWGGMFDGLVRDFHDTFGFGSLGREYMPLSRTQLFVAHGADSRYYDGQDCPSLGDITLRGLYAPLRETRRRPGVMLSANLKLPTGAASTFSGSGGWEGGGGVTVAKTWGNWRTELAGGYSVHTRWSGLPSVRLANTLDWHWCTEFRVDREWSILTQFSRTENALAKMSPDTFGKPSWRLGAAARALIGRRLNIEMAFFDNLAENNNTDDLTVQTSLRWNLP